MTSNGSPTDQSGTLTLSATAKSGTRKRARYLRLWEAIRLTRKEHTHWQSRVDRIMTNFNVQIRPREMALTRKVQISTGVLIDHAQGTSLNQSQAALLHLWIVDNLETLEQHPFSDKTETGVLRQRWNQLVHAEKHTLQQDETGASQQHDVFEDELNDDDIIFNFSSSYETPSHERYGDRDRANSQAKGNHSPHDESPHTQNQKSNSNDGPRHSSAASFSTAERVFGEVLSVDELFRPLARALHPDREQDESAKALKHSLMSQCLQAREENDIDTLLSLYIEHIGELPKGILTDSHDELIRMLDRQLKQEQWKLRQTRFNQGFEKMLLDRYQRDEPTAELSAFAEHANSLDMEIRRLSDQHELIKDESGLHSALKDRKLIEQDRVSISFLTGGS